MGNKAILMSIQPRWVVEILNGNKTIEVRKKFPKDYVGWVYIYCTKGKQPIMRGVHSIIADIKFDKNFKYYLNGKVVARFWCDKVEEIRCSWGSNFIDWSKYPSDERYDYYIGSEMDTCDICRVACLKMEELDNYLKGKKGYAIHISRLEVFDKPKELKKFVYYSKGNGSWCSWLNCIYLEHTKEECKNCKEIHIQKAPESWYYIEDK